MKTIVLDPSKATLSELIAAGETLQAAIEQRQATEKKEVVRQIRELAKKYNLGIQDILQEATKAERKPVKPKYQHPDNPTITWTGRGRSPDWMNTLMQQGIDKESLRIPE